MKTTRFTRVTVVADDRRLDVSLPADVVLAELIPTIVRLLGLPASPTPVRWALSAPESGALNVQRSLDELGVLDGRVLFLTALTAAALAPRVDDLETVVADVVDEVVPSWADTRPEGVAWLIAGVLSFTTVYLAMHVGSWITWWGCTGVAVASAAAGRLLRGPAGWCAAASAAPGYALLSFIVPLAGPTRLAGLLVGLAVGALQAGIVRRSVTITWAGIVAFGLSMIALVLTGGGVASGPTAGAVLVMALVAAGLAGHAGLALSGLTAMFVANEVGSDLPRVDVTAAVRRGNDTSVGWVSGAAAVAAVMVSVMVIGAEGPHAHPELSALVAVAGALGALAFALRSRRFTRAAQVWPMLAVGVVGLVTGSLSLPRWSPLGADARYGVALALLVVSSGLIVAFGAGRTGVVTQARLRRFLDVLEPVTVALLVPAVALCFGVVPAIVGWIS